MTRASCSPRLNWCAGGGHIDALLLNLVKANWCKPVANEGDIYALIACCEVGVSKLLDTMVEFGLNDLKHLSAYIIQTSRAGTQACISAMPQGTWSTVLVADGYDQPIMH
ncbi:MAG: hydantoinase B/oxoprolinase family protein [Roseobacter sp.]